LIRTRLDLQRSRKGQHRPFVENNAEGRVLRLQSLFHRLKMYGLRA